MSDRDLLIDAAAVARLARLVTADTILDPLRDRFLARFPNEAEVQNDGSYRPAHKLGELIVCPWCCSPYLAAGVLLARRYVPGLWDPIARVLGMSLAAGLAASVTEGP